MATAEELAKYRREATPHVGSPYRIQIYVTARCMGYTEAQALEVAKHPESYPKVVKRFEKGTR